MAASTYLCLSLTISMFFVSHASLPTLNLKFYQNVCKKPGEVHFEQQCLRLLQSHPALIVVNDPLTFAKLFVKTVALDRVTKAQAYLKQMMNKYPSSQPIKECATSKYNTMVMELKGVLIEDPEAVCLVVQYAGDALNECQTLLADEKTVNVSSIITLNNDLKFLIDIVRRASGSIKYSNE
ncbi:unnamed protein product [Vicia faba]|uniref:Pectinesterase inhibitor domain-containing protein n=1 Tax=Vicia faba TaxID=3906 RepID=A0AAV1AXH4_VICFA|nr:unnamed protein product [Vicia faba]